MRNPYKKTRSDIEVNELDVFSAKNPVWFASSWRDIFSRSLNFCEDHILGPSGVILIKLWNFVSISSKE